MTPIERFGHYTSRIEQLDSRIGAFLHLRLGAAEAEAQAAEERARRQAPLSPVDGLCIAVKANIAVAGLPHHAGIGAYRDDIAHEDAEVVRRLKSSGAVTLGIVNMHEGALGATTDNPFFGRTFNPWGRDLTPGGSSGGSAASVAARLCDAALGSDTMGSVRIPSAYCGIQGHKASAGWVPDAGVMALSATLDHVGPHARSVSILRDMLSVLSGRALTARPAGLCRLRLGIWRAAGSIDLTPAVDAGFAAACASLKAAGAVLHDVAPPLYAYGRSRRAGLLVSEVEASAVHARKLREDPGGFSDTFRALLSWGAARPQAEIDAAYAHLKEIREQAGSVFAGCDYIIAPVAPQQAFSFAEPAPANQADFTAWADFAALPAAAIFTGLSEPAGLPLSLQVIGRRDDDDGVLSAATAMEALFGLPPLPPGYE